MGYSSRYHVASLVGVFVALGIGILIGAALGSDVVSGTAENLEEDLGEDLDALRAENEDLGESLEFERSFSEEIAPAVVADRLAGSQIALIGLGAIETPVITDEVEEALDPTGAELAEVAVVREPPETEALIETLVNRRTGQASTMEELALAAERAGRILAGPGSLGEARGVLLAGASGDPEGIDAAVVARSRPEDLSAREQREVDTLETALIDGLRSAGVRVVGIERQADEPSSIPFFASQGSATVDSIDQLHGKVALALALAGAEGNFGVKETADGLLPELIPPSVSEPG